MRKITTMFAPLLMLSTACAMDTGLDDELQYGETENLVQSGNGTSLNGTSLNGTSLNGTSLNGTTLGSISVAGKNGTGGNVTAAYSSTTTPPLAGSSWINSTWTGTASNGVAVNLKIVSGAALASPNGEVWEYQIQYQNSAGWQPLCGVDTGGAPIKAITSAGVWSTTTATWSASSTSFTIACRGKAVAKCVELGYKTYKGYANQLASCVRMLRADYCGNNISYTVDGQLVNVFDNLNIQVDTQAWTKEGAWGPVGAKCLRTGGKLRYQILGLGTPSCAAALFTSTCGNTFGSGQYIIDEIQ
jgi:hypothetical protein